MESSRPFTSPANRTPRGQQRRASNVNQPTRSRLELSGLSGSGSVNPNRSSAVSGSFHSFPSDKNVLSGITKQSSPRPISSIPNSTAQDKIGVSVTISTTQSTLTPRRPSLGVNQGTKNNFYTAPTASTAAAAVSIATTTASSMTHEDGRRGSATAASKPVTGESTTKEDNSSKGEVKKRQPTVTSTQSKGDKAENKTVSFKANEERRGSVDSNSSSSSGKKSVMGGARHTEKNMTRRGSKGSIPSIVEPEVSHNETKVYVHRDGKDPILIADQPKAVKSVAYVDVVEDEDDSSNVSMFVRGRTSRRSSEPALGGHFLRALQFKANGSDGGDGNSYSNSSNKNPHPLSLSMVEAELKKSIEKDLPSQIVAEEDEDKYIDEINDEKTKNAAEAALTQIKPTSAKGIRNEEKAINGSANHGVNQSKTKQVNTTSQNGLAAQASKAEVKESRNSRNVNAKNATSQLDGRVSSADKKRQGKSEAYKSITSSGQYDPSAKSSVTKKSGSGLQNRRKSDGDVLRYARIWKLRAEHGSNSYRIEEADSEEPVDPSGKMTMWDAVRKCRYIRGYDPPDMKNTEDLSDFVFGN